MYSIFQFRCVTSLKHEHKRNNAVKFIEWIYIVSEFYSYNINNIK